MVVTRIYFSTENSYSYNFSYWSLKWNSSLLDPETNLINAQHIYILLIKTLEISLWRNCLPSVESDCIIPMRTYSIWNCFFGFGVRNFVTTKWIFGHCVPSTFRSRKGILQKTKLHNYCHYASETDMTFFWIIKTRESISKVVGDRKGCGKGEKHETNDEVMIDFYLTAPEISLCMLTHTRVDNSLSPLSNLQNVSY